MPLKNKETKERMKGYFSFPKSPGLEPDYNMQFCVISKTFAGGDTIFTQPLRSGRIGHKVNFLSGVKQV